MHRSPSRPARQRGFSLVELMVVVTMIGILAAIAFSSYQSSVLSSRRTEAKTAILDLAAREERNYTTSNNYTNVPSALGYTTGATLPLVVGSGYYQVDIPTVAQATATTPAQYVITATAIGTQVKDAACQIYTIDNTGKISVKNAAGNDNTAACL